MAYLYKSGYMKSNSCCSGKDLKSAKAKDLSSEPTPLLKPDDLRQAKTNRGSNRKDVGISKPFGIDIEQAWSLNVSAASTHDTTRPKGTKSAYFLVSAFDAPPHPPHQNSALFG